MAYLPNYSWDVFISYAHADNQASGWVSAFRKRLAPLIESGLDGEIDVFFDERDLRSYNTIESILTEVQKSALFVIVGSPNWTRPGRWTQQEFSAFVARHTDTSRIFIAEHEPPHPEQSYPAALPNNERVLFWSDDNKHQIPVPFPVDHPDFDYALRKLARDIRERLRALAVRPSDDPARPLAGGRHSVFLAHPTADVEEEHEALRDYLISQGVDVLPRGPLPPRAEGLRKQLADELPRAGLFVQLLGRRKARPLEGSEASPTLIQSEAAASAKEARDIFHWRPDDVDPHKNPDPEYKALLQGAENGTPTELAQRILARLDQIAHEVEKPPAPAGQCELRLVVSADPEDIDAARLLLEQCKGRPCEAMADIFDNDDLEMAQWVDADAVAFVQKDVPARTVMARYRVFNRVRTSSGAAGKLSGQALVFFPPPDNKAKGLIVAPGLEEIDLCRGGGFEPFIDWIERLGPSEPRADGGR